VERYPIVLKINALPRPPAPDSRGKREEVRGEPTGLESSSDPFLNCIGRVKRETGDFVNRAGGTDVPILDRWAARARVLTVVRTALAPIRD
jgi:hypothetical protein